MTRLALAIGGIAIGFAAIFFRLASPTDPLLASALRLGIAGLLLSPLAVRAVRDGTLSPRALRVALFGGVLYAVHFGAWVASLDRTTVAASVTIVTATPLLLAVMAFARGRDRPSPRTLVACVVAMIGAVIIGIGDATERGADALSGDVLALVGAIAMAVYLLVVRDLQEASASRTRHAPVGPASPGTPAELGKIPPLAFTGVAALSGAVVLGVAVLAMAPFTAITAPDADAFLFIALAALIPQIVGHGALTWALERATPTEVGLATAIEPVISTALAWVVFAERPSTVVGVGAAITLAAVVLGVALPRAPGKTGESVVPR